MPARPPVFKAPGTRPERKAWQSSAFKDKRKRGRAGQRERAQVLLEEPYCRECLKLGKQVKTDVVDHIMPLAWGGSDQRNNKQGLCTPCHDAKSLAERNYSAGNR